MAPALAQLTPRHLPALQHPTAGELRFITTAMKITAQLERMSELVLCTAEGKIIRHLVEEC